MKTRLSLLLLILMTWIAGLGCRAEVGNAEQQAPSQPQRTAAQPGAPEEAQSEPESLAPFVPTPQEVVEEMLKMAEVGSDDLVYDLGCGDGRIVITAAMKYGARGVGVDINPDRIEESRVNAREAQVEDKVQFVLRDAMSLNEEISKASVVTLYLLPSSNVKLRPMLEKNLKKGTRVVSHDFDMEEWEFAKRLTMRDHNGTDHDIYLWIIGEHRFEEEEQ